MIPDTIGLTLRPWSTDDFPLMERSLGDPAMTIHLGGPESPEQLQSRHQRYTEFSHKGPGCMYVMLVGPEKISAGSVGYWEKDWQDSIVWECGWNILPEFQGQGFATSATAELITIIRAQNKHPHLHAFPSIHNHPSNAICRKLSFTLVGEVDFEYPLGNLLRCNDWRLVLNPNIE